MWCVVFCKQKTAYEMRISDWSSDVCSSDLAAPPGDDSAVSARNDGAKAKHDSERRIIGIQPLQHCLHRGGANQRHVAIEDQHVAGKTVEASFGLLDRVPRSKLLVLHGDLYAMSGNSRLHLIPAQIGRAHV